MYFLAHPSVYILFGKTPEVIAAKRQLLIFYGILLAFFSLLLTRKMRPNYADYRNLAVLRDAIF
jgi:hypothetical protein